MFEFKNNSGERDIELKFTSRSYIDFISVSLSNYRWYFNNATENGLPISSMHFSQRAILGVPYTATAPYTGDVGDYLLNTRFEWSPANDINKKITIDGTEGAIHLYNWRPDLSVNSARAIEFKQGAKIILHNVPNGATVQISCLNTDAGGNGGMIAYYGLEGYWKSNIASFVQGSKVWGKLPKALQNSAKTTRVWANIGGLSSEAEYRDVKIYLPSMYDLGLATGDVVLAYANETSPDNPLSYFANTDASDSQNALVGMANQRNYSWWTRSASYYRFGYAQQIGSSGIAVPVDLRWTKGYVISRINI